MTHRDPHLVSNHEAPHETQDNARGSTAVSVIETKVVEAEPQMAVHASPSILTNPTGSAPASPVASLPPPRPAEFDYSKIPDPNVRKVAEKAAAKAMKVWE